MSEHRIYQTTYIYYSILADFAKEGKLKQLAYYLLIKGRTNSIIYDWNPKRLSNISKLHWKTCDRYTKYLIKVGFCKTHGKNFLFKNQQSTHPGNNLKFTIKLGSHEHILNQLYYLLVKNNYKQQYHNAAKQYGKNTNVLKRLNGVIKRNIFFSTRSIARLLGVSNVTANKIIRKLHNDKILSIRMNIVCVARMDYKKFKLFLSEVDYYIYYKNNYVYRHRGVSIAI